MTTTPESRIGVAEMTVLGPRPTLQTEIANLRRSETPEQRRSMKPMQFWGCSSSGDLSRCLFLRGRKDRRDFARPATERDDATAASINEGELTAVSVDFADDCGSSAFVASAIARLVDVKEEANSS